MEIIFVGFTFIVTLFLVLAVAWLLGFQVPPARLKPHSASTEVKGTVSVPADLPPVVQRFFDAIAPADGSGLPRLDTAVVWGRARQRLVVLRRRVWVPVTWKQQFEGGEAFHWAATVRWYRLPFGHGYDFFRDGHGEFGFGPEVARSRQLDQAENVRLWVESVWMPTVWLNDWRVQWEPADSADCARLVVPGASGADPESIEVWFDPETGLVDRIEAQRFRGVRDETPSLWTVTCLDWTTFHGVKVPARLQLAWNGEVYAVLRVDGVEYNVTVMVR